MCSGQNSLGKGGLNERYGLCKSSINKSSINRYVSFLPCVMDTDSVNERILKDLEDYIARCVECDFLPLIPDGTMYEINQYVDLNIVLTRKD